MKKLAIIAVLCSMMTLSAHAQWFDFSENLNRGVIGFNTGLVGYRGINNIPDMTFSDLGVGVSLNFMGVYADFLYVSPDHMYDSHIVMQDWEDHDAFTIQLCKYFEINASFTAHAAYAGIAFNLANFN